MTPGQPPGPVMRPVDPQAEQAEFHVATLKQTFGNEPTWGMVEMAFRTGWVAAETGWRYKAADDRPA